MGWQLFLQRGWWRRSLPLASSRPCYLAKGSSLGCVALSHLSVGKRCSEAARQQDQSMVSQENLGFLRWEGRTQVFESGVALRHIHTLAVVLHCNVGGGTSVKVFPMWVGKQPHISKMNHYKEFILYSFEVTSSCKGKLCNDSKTDWRCVQISPERPQQMSCLERYSWGAEGRHRPWWEWQQVCPPWQGFYLNWMEHLFSTNVSHFSHWNRINQLSTNQTKCICSLGKSLLPSVCC